MKKSTTKLSERNKRFWALPKKEKRIAIAKDVIKQINARFYNPTSGTYFRVLLDKDIPITSDTGLDTVMNKIKNQDAECEVCQIGACFASLVNLGDKVKAEDAFETTETVEYGDDVARNKAYDELKKVFSPAQLSLIECAFEQSLTEQSLTYIGAPFSAKVKAKKFGDNYKADTERMIAICQNIIKNNGTFRP